MTLRARPAARYWLTVAGSGRFQALAGRASRSGYSADPALDQDDRRDPQADERDLGHARHRVDAAVQAGDQIVFIAAGAEHRAPALEACRWMIDELKERVPIWKKETTPQGESWVTPHP